MKITEIMDNYRDNEFLIEGDQLADVEKVLQGVNAKVKVKKHLKLHTKIIIAVAAAFIGLFAVTAATPVTTLVSRLGSVYKWSETLDSYVDNGRDSHEDVKPYKIVDGRVIFTAVDEGEDEIDITDLISDIKPFYYKYKKAASNGVVYDFIIAVGGTPDDLGYCEGYFHLSINNGEITGATAHGSNTHFVYYMIDGKDVLGRDLTEEQYNNREKYPCRHEEKPWAREFDELMGFNVSEEETLFYVYPPEEITNIS
ncbi:MAG: hypothetical protein HDT44_09655 [Ruminococcaceae bacterium]|nr:hypothetical protein [Oscillospiraceae bacterium]